MGNATPYSGQDATSKQITDIMSTLNRVEFSGISGSGITSPRISFDFEFDASVSTSGGFGQPAGIAVDSRGDIYVVDRDFARDRVVKFDATGTFLIEFALGTLPEYVLVDEFDNVWVTEGTGNRVAKYDTSGVFQSSFGGPGTGDGQFDDPRGIVKGFTSNHLYVVDQGNARIQKFTTAGAFVAKVGSLGGGDGQFGFPKGIAIDSDDNIYVIDASIARVQKFNSSLVFQLKWGSNGDSDGEFRAPVGIGISSSDFVYISDDPVGSVVIRTQVFDTSGVFIADLQESGFSGSVPISTVIGGRLYISLDRGVNAGVVRVYRIHAISFNQAFDASGSTNGDFKTPEGVAVDSLGNIYVADAGSTPTRVIKFDSSFVFQIEFALNTTPYDIYIDGSDNVWVTEFGSNRVAKYNTDGVFQSSFGSTGSGDGQFMTIRGLILDSSGNFYVVDSNLNRVQKFNSSGVFQSKVGSPGSGDGQFGDPRGIAIDSDNNIYVVEAGGNRVQKFNSNLAFQLKWSIPQAGLDITVSSSDFVYVVNGASGAAFRDIIQIFDTSGTFIVRLTDDLLGQYRSGFVDGAILYVGHRRAVTGVSIVRIYNLTDPTEADPIADSNLGASDEVTARNPLIVVSGTIGQTNWQRYGNMGTSESLDRVVFPTPEVADNALVAQISKDKLQTGEVCGSFNIRVVRDMRTAMEALAASGLITNIATGNTLTWDFTTDDDLYRSATTGKLAAMGRTTGTHSWTRSLPSMSGTRILDVDITEMKLCADFLEACVNA